MRHALGIDIGGTNLRAALIDENYQVVRKEKVSSRGALAESLIGMIQSLIDSQTVGIGVAVAGIVDRVKKRVLSSPNLPAVEELDFKDIERRFSLPLYLENDANAFALGEKTAGIGKDYDDFILLTLGTGIGGGVVCGGRLLDIPAELGHVTVEIDGRSCPCGNTGCLEMYASGTAIVNSAVNELEQGRESMLRECCDGNFYKITPENIYEYALEGDQLAREVLKDAGRYLGAGIASFVNIFGPQAVLIGGGVSGAWDILIEEGKKEIKRRAFEQIAEDLKVVPASLGDDAGVVGAAALVFGEEDD